MFCNQTRAEPITRFGHPFPGPTVRHFRLSPVGRVLSLWWRLARPPARPVGRDNATKLAIASDRAVCGSFV